LLALFLIAHMGFVASVLISPQLFESVARFFEGAWLFGKPYPQLVSLVAAAISALLIGHAWLAMRKFPASYRQYQAFSRHQGRLRHGDTGLWWLQLWTGFLLFFLASIHLYDMLSQPATIGIVGSAQRVGPGGRWPLYLLLLLSVELHASAGLYRLAVKWLPVDDATRQRLRHLRHAFSAFFILLGLLTLITFYRLSLVAGETPPTHSQPPVAAMQRGG
jgi:fumarate reductase subunit C